MRLAAGNRLSSRRLPAKPREKTADARGQIWGERPGRLAPGVLWTSMHGHLSVGSQIPMRSGSND